MLPLPTNDETVKLTSAQIIGTIASLRGLLYANASSVDDRLSILALESGN